MSRWKALVAFLVLATSSCASISPVTTYADETKKFSASFEPMLTGSKQTCINSFVRKKLITSSSFDAKAAKEQAEMLCASIDTDNQAIAKLNALLQAYADTLAGLANEKLPDYSAQFQGLGDTLGQLKRRGSNETLLDQKKVTAIANLASYLAKLSTQRASRKAIDDLLAQEESVFALVDALSLYATLNYQAWLRDEQRSIAILTQSLDAQAAKEPLAANHAKAVLLTDSESNTQKQEAIPKFIKAAEALKASHIELRKNLRTPDDAELAKQLQNYANEISELRKQLRQAYSE